MEAVDVLVLTVGLGEAEALDAEELARGGQRDLGVLEGARRALLQLLLVRNEAALQNLQASAELEST